VRSSRSGLSGIKRPVENLNRNPRQATKLLSQQNLPKAAMVELTRAKQKPPEGGL
jgi:hypothetical protein